MTDSSGPDYTPLPDWTRMDDPQVAEATRRAAYARLLGSPLGRQVLADFLGVCSVGAPKLPLVGQPGLLEHAAGMGDAALALVELAGLDGADLRAHLIDAGQEGYFDGRSDYE